MTELIPIIYRGSMKPASPEFIKGVALAELILDEQERIGKPVSF